MPNMLGASNALVKPSASRIVNLGDERVSRSRHNGGMSNMPSRILLILSTRGWSQRELARRAGLKSESHIGLLLSEKAADVRLSTLLAIAQGAEVPFAWLATGEGDSGLGQTSPRAEPVVEYDDRYPNRPAALQAARDVGLDPDAIEFVSKMVFKSDTDFPAKEWLEMIQAEASARRTRRMGREVKGPQFDGDEF